MSDEQQHALPPEPSNVVELGDRVWIALCELDTDLDVEAYEHLATEFYRGVRLGVSSARRHCVRLLQDDQGLYATQIRFETEAELLRWISDMNALAVEGRRAEYRIDLRSALSPLLEAIAKKRGSIIPEVWLVVSVRHAIWHVTPEDRATVRYEMLLDRISAFDTTKHAAFVDKLELLVAEFE